MGLLLDGVWQDKWYGTKSTGGRFVRNDAVFRNWITAGGSAGPSGEAGLRQSPATITCMSRSPARGRMSHPQINPARIVPLGPEQNLDAPHDRARLA